MSSFNIYIKLNPISSAEFYQADLAFQLSTLFLVLVLWSFIFGLFVLIIVLSNYTNGEMELFKFYIAPIIRLN